MQKSIKLMLFVIILFLYSFDARSQTGEPIVIGHKFKIDSQELAEEKQIFISLPHKYDEGVHSYPIVFVLEAEILFEPTNTVSKMMAQRSKMPQSIIVGLANGTYKKRHELSHKRWKGKPEAYIKFFKDELIPYLENKYRVNSHRTIIGLSSTNGFIYEALLNEPNLFNSYIALSAHLEWPRNLGVNLIDEIIAKTSEANYPKINLYLGRADGDAKEDSEVQKAYDDAKEKLQKSKSENLTYKIEIIANEEHYLMSLAGIRSGFETIYPNSLWKNPGWRGWDKNNNYAQSYYKPYFDKLSSIYGFDIYPVEDGHAYGYYLAGKANSAIKWGTNKQEIELLELGIGYYPNSANMHMMLAQAYIKANQPKKSLDTAKKAILHAKKYHPNELQSYQEKLLQIEKLISKSKK